MFPRIWERSNFKIEYTWLKKYEETILESFLALVLILLHTSLHVNVPIVSSHMLRGYEHVTPSHYTLHSIIQYSHSDEQNDAWPWIYKRCWDFEKGELSGLKTRRYDNSWFDFIHFQFTRTHRYAITLIRSFSQVCLLSVRSDTRLEIPQ